MTPDVQTERAKRSELYSSGEPRVKMAKEDDSPAPQEEKKKGCFVCGGLERGDTWVSLPDEEGIGRVIHTPIRAIGNKSVDRNVGCLETFTTRVETAAKRKVLEEKQDLALEALRREGGAPRLPPPPVQRGYDCFTEGCNRFFDSENGRALHQRKGHKVGVGV